MLKTFLFCLFVSQAGDVRALASFQPIRTSLPVVLADTKTTSTSLSMSAYSNHNQHRRKSGNQEDPYEILNIPSKEKATMDEIKKAYRLLALQYHPDKRIKDDSTEEEREKAHNDFAKINAAYATLSGKEEAGGVKQQLQRRREQQRRRQQQPQQRHQTRQRNVNINRNANSQCRTNLRTATGRTTQTQTQNSYTGQYGGTSSRNNSQEEESQSFGRYNTQPVAPASVNRNTKYKRGTYASTRATNNTTPPTRKRRTKYTKNHVYGGTSTDARKEKKQEEKVAKFKKDNPQLRVPTDFSAQRKPTARARRRKPWETTRYATSNTGTHHNYGGTTTDKDKPDTENGEKEKGTNFVHYSGSSSSKSSVVSSATVGTTRNVSNASNRSSSGSVKTQVGLRSSNIPPMNWDTVSQTQTTKPTTSTIGTSQPSSTIINPTANGFGQATNDQSLSSSSHNEPNRNRISSFINNTRQVSTGTSSRGTSTNTSTTYAKSQINNISSRSTIINNDNNNNKRKNDELNATQNEEMTAFQLQVQQQKKSKSDGNGNGNSNDDETTRTQSYKNLIASDMERVRNYVAQKKSSNGLHRHEVKSSTFPSKLSVSSNSQNKDITMWDVMNKESIKTHQTKLTPMSRTCNNVKNRVLFVMKRKEMKRFKTPKKTPEEDEEKQMMLEGKENKVLLRFFQTLSRKSSIFLAIVLLIVHRMTRLVIHQWAYTFF